MDDRHVVLVAFEGVQLLDMAGPADVFRTATLLGATPGYRLSVASPGGGPFTTVSGVRCLADRSIGSLTGRELDAGPDAGPGAGPDAVPSTGPNSAPRRDGSSPPIDTLMVLGGLGVGDAAADPEIVRDVHDAAARARRLTSVCTGAMLLAAAGLLDGYEATTHWSSTDALAARHPLVRVQPDRIYVHDRDRWTSAGVTAGIDLALALVEADHGHDLARAVAAWLVVFVQRPGGQSQFSVQLQSRPARRQELSDLQRWLPDHLTEDLGVGALAARAGMSERTFVRSFRAEVGTTPAAYVEALRVEAARALLERTDLTVAAVAREVGLGRPERLHRAVRRQLGTTPGSYRQHFARA